MKIKVKSIVNNLDNVHIPQSVVYKVDQFVLGTLLSSLVLLNTKVCFYLLGLSYNNTEKRIEGDKKISR